MQKMTHQVESMGNAPALYMAFELGVKKWLVAYGTTMGGAVVKRPLPMTSSQAMVDVVRALIVDAKVRFGLARDAPVRSCHEAGRDGFWVHRMLTSLGVVNSVVDSSSIEVNRRARQAKTDRLDATKLLRMLLRYWQGERALWHVVRVPGVAEEDARHGTRVIATLVKERTRWRNRIHALLMLHGVRFQIRPHFTEQLAAARGWDGEPLPPGVRARIAAAWAQVQQLSGALLAFRREARRTVRQAQTAASRWADRVHQLRGIGRESALTLGQEVMGRGLRNRREVGALTGMVPLPYQSGDTARAQGISRAGNRHIRGLAVELAWVWLQWQPKSALTRWYQRRWASGGPRMRRVGIVALGRKLVIALWRYGQGGATPTGAELRACPASAVGGD